MKQYVIILILCMYSFFIQTMEKQTIYYLEKKDANDRNIASHKTFPSLLQKVDEAYLDTVSARAAYDNISLNSLNVFTIEKEEKWRALVYASKKYIFLNEQYKNIVEIQYAISPSMINNNTLKITRALIPTLMCPSIQGKHITRLHASRNNLTDLPLGFLLQQIPNLEDLNVSHNNISYLSTIETTNSKLQHVDISFNALEFFNLEEFLNKNNALEHINVSSNPLKTITLKHFPHEFSEKNLNINVQYTELSHSDQKNIREKYIECAQYLYKKSLEKDVDDITTFMTSAIGATAIHAVANFFNAGPLMEMVLTIPTAIGINRISRRQPIECIKKFLYSFLEKRHKKELDILAQKQQNIIF